MKRVLVVDDSAAMRRQLREGLERYGEFHVLSASNGIEALEQIPQLEPHVVTLDVNLPMMDGLTCLAHVMNDMPRPVVMVSSLTADGANATLDALARGAVDYVAKDVSLQVDADELRAKVSESVGARVVDPGRLLERLQRKHAARARPSHRLRRRRGVVLIGVSSGGTGALGDVLGRLPADFSLPIVVAQHLPASFSGPLARRLDGECALRVEELTGTRDLEPGVALIARGDADVILTPRGTSAAARSVPAGGKRWHPSVDRLVRSGTQCFRAEQIIAVELTGVGDDGAAAMAELRRAGARTIAESRESAVLFGMPGELIRLGGASAVLSADAVAGQLLDWVR